MIDLSTEVKMAIKLSKILFCDGFAFMVLPPDTIGSALDYAIEVGRSVFFDPGPQGKLLASGTPAEQKELDSGLRLHYTSIGLRLCPNNEILDSGFS